jgi:thymidine phosphorylase
MATLTRVDLSLAEMRRVGEEQNGCIVWGGSVRLSPADDVLIRVERALDIDSEPQLIASVLSKKAAAGSTHVVLDIPVGPTAKVRSQEDARKLASSLVSVGERIGLHVRPIVSDGLQPVGRGIGPALEARDVLAVLNKAPGAPADLRERSLDLAGEILELGGACAVRKGRAEARRILASGRALQRFVAICEAQGGFWEPGRAAYSQVIESSESGRITSIDNRLLARIAKLAGAPADPTAGLEIHGHLKDRMEKGQPLFTIHSESRGELEYALAYFRTAGSPFTIEGGKAGSPGEVPDRASAQ